MRFWTSYQHPLFQAALVENKKVVRAIPDRGPKTPARRVGVVGQFDDKLVLLRRSSWEVWSKDGEILELESYDPFVYGPHAVEQVGNEMLICGSGHDIFYMTDLEGNITWKWMGHHHGLGGVPHHLYADDWVTRHVTGNDNPTPQDGWHYNSIWIEPEGTHFLTSSLKKGVVVRIPIKGTGGEIVAKSTGHGLHSPIRTSKGELAYGLERGISCAGQVKAPYLSWPKYIRWIGDRYMVTHEGGITWLDEHWNPIENVKLPRPFRFTLLEQ